jgi:hypothetical protein
LPDQLLAWRYTVAQYLIELSKNNKDYCFNCKEWTKTDIGLILLVHSCSIDEYVNSDDPLYMTSREFLSWRKVAELANAKGLQSLATIRRRNMKKDK